MKIRVEPSELKILESLERNANISALASKIIRESLFVSLISQYDAFLTRLLKTIFEIKPEVLNGSDRNLTFSQLVEMESIKNARDYIIDKEVDTVLRKRHSDHFDYMESLIGITLREKLPIWKTFIEITERRNLLVHCDGIVTNQYIKNCEEHECEINLSEVKVGTRLGVSLDYFTKAYECLYEITVKLTHTIWRKLLKSDLEDADRDLNNICYDLINTSAFKLADILLEFACGQRHHYNDTHKNVYIINCALSKYLQDDKKEATKILGLKDWSASSDDFKLANEVLNDRYEKVYSIMKKIGNNGEIAKSSYKEWPLFTKIRDEKKFKEVYKSIFKEDYSVLEIPKRPIQELITKEIEKDKASSVKVDSKKHSLVGNKNKSTVRKISPAKKRTASK